VFVAGSWGQATLATQVQALSASSGALLWNVSLPDHVDAPATVPVLGGGRLFFGCPWGVLALSAINGSLLWRRSPSGLPEEGLVLGAPVYSAAAGLLFVSQLNSGAFALREESGENAWFSPDSYSQVGGALDRDGRLFLLNSEGALSAFSAANGSLLQRSVLPAAPGSSGPALSGSGALALFSPQTSLLLLLGLPAPAPAPAANPAGSSSNGSSLLGTEGAAVAVAGAAGICLLLLLAALRHRSLAARRGAAVPAENAAPSPASSSSSKQQHSSTAAQSLWALLLPLPSARVAPRAQRSAATSTADFGEPLLEAAEQQQQGSQQQQQQQQQRVRVQVQHMQQEELEVEGGGEEQQSGQQSPSGVQLQGLQAFTASTAAAAHFLWPLPTIPGKLGQDAASAALATEASLNYPTEASAARVGQEEEEEGEEQGKVGSSCWGEQFEEHAAASSSPMAQLAGGLLGLHLPDGDSYVLEGKGVSLH
jgi:hypothetical protein